MFCVGEKSRTSAPAEIEGVSQAFLASRETTSDGRLQGMSLARLPLGSRRYIHGGISQAGTLSERLSWNPIIREDDYLTGRRDSQFPYYIAEHLFQPELQILGNGSSAPISPATAPGERPFSAERIGLTSVKIYTTIGV